MKYKITNEQIELCYSFYQIIFPNNQYIKFIFNDKRKVIGNLPKQTGLMIYSKDKKYKPWYGVLSRVISKSGVRQVSGYIFEIKNIEEFLIEAKAKNYNVNNILEEVLSAKKEKIKFFGI